MGFTELKALVVGIECLIEDFGRLVGQSLEFQVMLAF